MHRTQVRLTDKQIEVVRAIAAKKEISIAEIIRMSVDSFIQKEESKIRLQQKKRALSAIGKFRSGLNDLAQNHDKYLAEDMAK
ncbi:CopG family transcriptional regulator [bacterium]|nr:CopG family transcriptional regulator [bacterium]